MFRNGLLCQVGKTRTKLKRWSWQEALRVLVNDATRDLMLWPVCVYCFIALILHLQPVIVIYIHWSCFSNRRIEYGIPPSRHAFLPVENAAANQLDMYIGAGATRILDTPCMECIPGTFGIMPGNVLLVVVEIYSCRKRMDYLFRESDL